MWSDPQPALATTTEPAPLPVRFVLAGEGPHALSPGQAIGSALRDEPEPEPGWEPHGFTSRDLDRIGCDGCRQVAGRLTEAARKASPEPAQDQHPDDGGPDDQDQHRL